MRIYVTHDDGAEVEYDVSDLRVTTPAVITVEYSQIVLSEPDPDALREERQDG